MLRLGTCSSTSNFATLHWISLSLSLSHKIYIYMYASLPKLPWLVRVANVHDFTRSLQSLYLYIYVLFVFLETKAAGRF